jgi:AraC family transcriptional regulator of arabinose operon
MYTNSAYLHNSLLDIVDKSRPLIVTSCGTYKLYTQKEFTTYRPKGRKDYQLIYVAAGKAHFEIDGKDMIACPGNMVIYRPRQMQRYCMHLSLMTSEFRQLNMRWRIQIQKKRYY